MEAMVEFTDRTSLYVAEGQYPKMKLQMKQLLKI